eukprot:5918757-Alexandrium_andersonii.AAC.1
MVGHRVVRPVGGLRPELCVPHLLGVALELQHLHGPRPLAADDGLRQCPEVPVRHLVACRLGLNRRRLGRGAREPPRRVNHRGVAQHE